MVWKPGPAADRLCDKAKSLPPSTHTTTERLRIDDTTHAAFRGFCAENSITPAASLFAALQASHFHLTRSRDAVLGAVVSDYGRNSAGSISESLIRILVHSVIERQTYDQLVLQAQEHFASQIDRQNTSSGQSGTPSTQLAPVQLSLVLHRRDGLDVNDASRSPISVPQVSPYYSPRTDLEVHVFQYIDGIEYEASYFQDIFPAETARKFLVIFRKALEAGLADRRGGIETMNLFSDDGLCKLDTSQLLESRQHPQMEYLGRVDGQGKVKGHPVEVEEIENCLRAHRSVKDAAVIALEQEGGETQLSGFVSVDETAVQQNAESDQHSDTAKIVDTWNKVFDDVAYSAIEDVDDARIGRDFVGWTSTIDGRDLDETEMDEWLGDTIVTLLNGGAARNVLEIGTGSGMILFNLGAGLQSYIGLEPSEKAVAFAMKAIKANPSLQGKAYVYQGTAADLKRLPGPVLPDLVVINSVLQYFPSQDYLSKALVDITELGSVQTIFLGDIRSFPMDNQHRVSRAMFEADEATTKAALRESIDAMERQDLELTVDPAFFVSLQDRLPGQIHHVEILPKGMKACNELSRYRYAAVIHLRASSGQDHEVREVAESDWVDFEVEKLDQNSLAELLRSAKDNATIAVGNVPFKDTILERHIIENLDKEERDQDWIAEARLAASNCQSMSVSDLQELAASHGYRVELSWARQYSNHGALDAIFHRYRPTQGDRVMFRFPTDHERRPVHQFSSQPMKRSLHRKIQDELVVLLKDRLPERTVPALVEVLDALPVDASGRVDRAALAAGHEGRPATRAAQRISQAASTGAYWKSMFEDDVERVFFPAESAGIKQTRVDDILEHETQIDGRWTGATGRISTVTRAALALLMSRYTGEKDVVFGVAVTRHNPPVSGVEQKGGPAIATLPLRIQLDGSQTADDYLETLQRQAVDMIPHEQIGLQNIAGLGPGTRNGCAFTALLVMQEGESDGLGDQRPSVGSPLPPDSPIGDMAFPHAIYTHPLTIECALKQDSVKLRAAFDTAAISTWNMRRFLRQLSTMMELLVEQSNGGRRLADINGLPGEDIEQLWAWNKDIPETTNRCVQDVISDRVREQPAAPAVSSWDGELSYGELERFSDSLADRLRHLGVRHEEAVPLCFEKSAWTVVAILAVLKAGAAFVPLDAEQAPDRRRSILDQVKARIVLTSPAHKETALSTGCSVCVVDRAAIAKMHATRMALQHTPGSEPDDQNERPVDPAQMAYIMFTSGSTGTPKGVVLEHAAVSSSCLNHGKRARLSNASRVLQFSSYTFDISIMEILTTLMYGGCVCTPSDSQRLGDLSGAMRTMQVNFAVLTPTVAQTLRPTDVPGLQGLMLGAEAASRFDMGPWQGTGARLFNAYGPTECAVCSVICCDPSADDLASDTIGERVGCCTWLVDPRDHDKLMPPGMVGELLIEGPILARGYLDDAEKTRRAFIDDPAWLLAGTAGHVGRRGRMYKTGDLVYYRQDGRLAFVGRKHDGQVRVNGRRVELGEVEAQVLACVPAAKRAAAVLLQPEGLEGGGGEMLAAFVELDGGDGGVGTFTASSLKMLAEDSDGMAELRQRLPRYMIPRVVFAVNTLPTTTSSKLDRRRLTLAALAELRAKKNKAANIMAPAVHGQTRPRTDAERVLCGVWERVFGLGPGVVGVDDSFFDRGGDSITALKLVADARRQGGALPQALSVQDVFQNPTISALARILSTTETERVLCGVWERVFGLGPGTIGVDDNFFHRGGDSITALKLVADARRQRSAVTHALSAQDVFNHPTVSALARMISTAKCAAITVEHATSSTPTGLPPAFSLVDERVRVALLASLPPAEQSNVSDILPTNSGQRAFIRHGLACPLRSLDYFWIDLGPQANVDKMVTSCCKLFGHNAMLRSRFMPAFGRYWQVVHTSVDVPVDVVDTCADIDRETLALCLDDTKKGFNYLGLPTRFTIIRTRNQGCRLILRLSHAQYDGLGFATIVEPLLHLYHGRPFKPAAEFPLHLQMVRDRDAASLRYWRQLLRGSKLTAIAPLLYDDSVLSARHSGVHGRINATKTILTPRPPQNMTLTSLIGAAWASVLSDMTGTHDIVYAMMVSGRNQQVSADRLVAGPCINFIPFRLQIAPSQTHREVMALVQHQYLSAAEVESCDWDRIVDKCTDWPADTMHDPLLVVQNIEENPYFRVDGVDRRLEAWEDVAYKLSPFIIVAYPGKKNLTMSVEGRDHILSEKTAERLLATLCKKIESFSV
jgi:amino acid adenylation domain-containing protein